MQLWRPRRCNCLVWAVVMWCRHGGRVRAQGSIYGWWPHWMWISQGRVYEYAPPVHEHGRKRPPLFFAGRAQQVIGEIITRTVHDGVTTHAEIIRRMEVLSE